MPNAVDVRQTAELFATFEDNPVVVTIVGCLCVAYVLVVICARRKDAQDQAKVRLHSPWEQEGGAGVSPCRGSRGWSPGGELRGQLQIQALTPGVISGKLALQPLDQ